MRFVYQFAQHLVGKHENTLLEDGFHSDLAANGATDVAANGKKVEWQTVHMAHRQTSDRHSGKRPRGHKDTQGT